MWRIGHPVMGRFRAPSTHLWTWATTYNRTASNSTTLVSLSLRCDTAIAEIKEMQIHIEKHHAYYLQQVRIYDSICEVNMDKFKRPETTVRSLVYQWEYFGILCSTRASGLSRLEQFANDDDEVHSNVKLHSAQPSWHQPKSSSR